MTLATCTIIIIIIITIIVPVASLRCFLQCATIIAVVQLHNPIPSVHTVECCDDDDNDDDDGVDDCVDYYDDMITAMKM